MMGALSYDNFVVNLANEIDEMTNHFVFDGYTALASFLKGPLGAMIVLYIVMMGYAMVRGLVNTPKTEFFKFAFRVGLIYMTAMNWDFFASYVRDFFVVGSESIATALMQAVHHTSGSSINQGLQNVLNEIFIIGGDLFEAGSFRKLTPYFAGFMVLLSGSITIGLAFIEIVVAKLMLAVTLCTAPLFIVFTLFDQTKSFFDRWLGLLVGFSLVLVFVSSVVGLCVHLLHWVAVGMLHHPEQLKAAIWVPIFIVASLCVIGITEAASIGKSIGSAFCTSGGAAMVGGFVGGSLGAMAFSKNVTQRHMNLARMGLSGSLQKGKQLGASSKAMIQKMQQNLRRGAS